jgi:hypothetical protein
MIPKVSAAFSLCGCPFLWPDNDNNNNDDDNDDTQNTNQPRKQNHSGFAVVSNKTAKYTHCTAVPVSKSSSFQNSEQVDDIISMRSLFRKSRNKEEDVEVQPDTQRKGGRMSTLFGKKNNKNKKSSKNEKPAPSSEESTVPTPEATFVDVTPVVENAPSKEGSSPGLTEHTVTSVDSDVSSDTASVEAAQNVSVAVVKDEEPADEPACYLVYEPGSSGRLVEHYSTTPVIEDAVVGRWVAKGGKKIAGFKFTCNAGRNVLIGSCSAGVQGRKNYCNGWCQFVRSCKIMEGEVTIFEIAEGVKAMPVDVYLYYDRRNHQTVKLEPGSPLTTDSLVAVACLPRSSPFFETNDTVDVMKWLQDARAFGYSTKI